MKQCPFCAEAIQTDAVKCRYCGEFLDNRMRSGGAYGYEYRSTAEIAGWPLIHIAQGVDPRTGRPRVARGIIAIGNVAIGLIALGGFAFGGIALGGISIGVFALAGVAIGVIALGGVAAAVHLAVGGLALSLSYALGGLALAPHSIDSRGVDPEALELFRGWLRALDE